MGQGHAVAGVGEYYRLEPTLTTTVVSLNVIVFMQPPQTRGVAVTSTI